MPEQTVPRSSTSTSTPCSARWKAMAQPITPPPTTTTLAPSPMGASLTLLRGAEPPACLPNQVPGGSGRSGLQAGEGRRRPEVPRGRGGLAEAAAQRERGVEGGARDAVVDERGGRPPTRRAVAAGGLGQQGGPAVQLGGLVPGGGGALHHHRQPVRAATEQPRQPLPPLVSVQAGRQLQDDGEQPVPE